VTAPLSIKERLGVLAEHYRETFSHQREYLARRDRLLAYSILAVAALALRASHSSTSDRVLVLAIEHVIGTGAQLDGAFLSVLLWFVFFAVTARYFQATITVERHYTYIDRVEQEMSVAYGGDVLSREGASYAARYPKFSEWMHAVYMWLFPVAVTGVTIWAIVGEFERRPRETSTWIVLFIALATLATVVLYVYSVHFENKERPAAESAHPDVSSR
jgi:hypothetical protein